MNPWIGSTPPSDTSSVQLFCLPHAGGGTAPYYRWRRYFSPSICLLPIQLPGRESRFKEAAYHDLKTLVCEMHTALGDTVREPFALFGHSMGGLIAFEWALRLRAAGKSPSMLFVSACPAPRNLPQDRHWHVLPDQVMIDTLLAAYGDPGGTDPNERQMMQWLAPTLRADLTLLENYRYADSPPLDHPIVALLGSDDDQVRPADASAWRQHTTAACEIRTLPGRHFFLRDQESAVTRLILRKLVGPAARQKPPAE